MIRKTRMPTTTISGWTNTKSQYGKVWPVHISTRKRPKSCTVSLAFEEQKRLVVPGHDEADRNNNKRTLSPMDLLSWDYCSDMAWFLLQSGQNDRRVHEMSATESNKGGVGLCHDCEVVSEEVPFAIAIEMGCTSSEIHPRNKLGCCQWK